MLSMSNYSIVKLMNVFYEELNFNQSQTSISQEPSLLLYVN